MSLPTPSATPHGSPPLAASPSSPLARRKPVLYLPTPIHPAARALAADRFDVIDADSPRAATWTDEADAVVVRQGGVSADEARRAVRLRIIARNGCAAGTFFSTCRSWS